VHLGIETARRKLGASLVAQGDVGVPEGVLSVPTSGGVVLAGRVAGEAPISSADAAGNRASLR
jgi:hypothetical protein